MDEAAQRGGRGSGRASAGRDGDVTWIFAYGSLVSPASLATTIGRTVEPGPGRRIVELAGWRRAWNYGSASLRGDWTADDGREVVGGLVVSLGLVAEPAGTANGVALAVDADELAHLDRRERAYDRVDVSASITPLDGLGPLGAPVATYVPRPDAIERYERHRDEGTAAVRRWYHDLVRSAFAELGDEHGERYLATTPDPDVPIHDVRLDPRSTSATNPR